MNIIRVQGCATPSNILGLLFGEPPTERIIPLKIKTYKKRYKAKCSMDGCQHYRIGTLGSTRVSWDAKGKRM